MHWISFTNTNARSTQHTDAPHAQASQAQDKADAKSFKILPAVILLLSVAFAQQ